MGPFDDLIPGGASATLPPVKTRIPAPALPASVKKTSAPDPFEDLIPKPSKLKESFGKMAKGVLDDFLGTTAPAVMRKAPQDPEAFEGRLRAVSEVVNAIPAVAPWNVIVNTAIQAQETGLDIEKLIEAAKDAVPYGKLVDQVSQGKPVGELESVTAPRELKSPRRLIFNVLKAINPNFKEPKAKTELGQIAMDLGLDLVAGAGPAALEMGVVKAANAASIASRKADALRALKTLKNLPERKLRIRVKRLTDALEGAPKQLPPPAGKYGETFERLTPEESLSRQAVPKAVVEEMDARAAALAAEKAAPPKPSKIKRPIALLEKSPIEIASAPIGTTGARKTPSETLKTAVELAMGRKKPLRGPLGNEAGSVRIGKSFEGMSEKELLEEIDRLRAKGAIPDDELVMAAQIQRDKEQALKEEATSLRRAAEAQEPGFKKALAEIAGKEGSFEPGPIKTVKRMVEKAAGKGPGYEIGSMKDHLRGAVFVDDFANAGEAMAAIKKKFPGAKFEVKNLEEPFGYTSIHASAPIGKGVNAEIQIHTPASWKLKKGISDKIFRKWREELRDIGALPPQRRAALLREMKKSKASWEDFYDKQSQAARDFLEGGAGLSEPTALATKAAGLIEPSSAQVPVASSLTSGKPPLAIGPKSASLPSASLTKNDSMIASTENITADPAKIKLKLKYTKGNKLANERGMARVGDSFEGMSEDEIRAEVTRLIGDRLKGVAKGNKERKFITSVSKDPKTAPQIAVGVEGEYTPVPNQKTLDQANKIIADDFEAAYKMALSDEAPTNVSNAVAQRMVQELQKLGRFEDAINVVEKTAAKATEQGRAIQALSIYSRLTPEGVLQFAQKTLDKAAREVTKGKPAVTAEVLKQLPKEVQDLIKQTKGYISEDQLKKLPPALQQMVAKNAVPPASAQQLQKLKMTPKLTQQLQGLAAKVQTANTPRQRAVATAQLLKAIANQTPVSVWKKISAIQTMAQLINFKTFGRNILGNVGFAGLENISDATAAAFDKAVSLATGKRSKVLPNFRVQFRGLQRGFREGVEDVKLGINTSGLSGQHQLPAPGIFKSKVGQAFEKTLNYELQVPDRMAYTAAYRESLLNQMKAAKVSKPTADMLEIAHHDGLYRTFQDDNVITKVFVGLKKALNAGGEFGLGDAIIKYPKTPANILARGIDYSPAGFIKSMLELSKGLLGHGFDQRKFVEAASRAFTGSTLVGTGILMAKLGLITGRKKEGTGIKELKKKIGLGDFKINISGVKRFVLSGFDPEEAKLRKGDVFKSYDWFLPQAISIAIGANIEENKGKSTGVVGVLADAIGAGTRTLAEQPLVSGLQRAFGYGDVVGGMSEILKGIPASFVPSLLRQVGMLVDDIRRNPDSEDPIAESANLVRLKLPGFSKGVKERKDPFADTVHYLRDSKSPAGKAFSALMDPAITTRYGEDPATPQTEELIKYGVNVTQQGKTIQGIELTQEERDAINSVTGPMAKKFLGYLISSSNDETRNALLSGLKLPLNYEKLNDLGKQKALEAAIRAAKTLAETKNAPAIAKRFLGKKKAEAA